MELQDKIKGIISGLFGSIIASFCVSLGASLLIADHRTIVLSGLIVGLACSFANAFGPLVSSTRMITYQRCSAQDIEQALGSFMLTFIFVILPLVSYMVIANLALARIIAIITGLALLFILGVHQAQLEHRSPLRNGFVMAIAGVISAAIFYFLATLIQ